VEYILWAIFKDKHQLHVDSTDIRGAIAIERYSSHFI